MNHATIADVFAKFAVGTGPGGFPDTAIERARWCLLDLVGAGLAGAASESGQAVLAWARDAGGDPQAGVFGSGLRLPAGNAACVNGTMAHALELDDIHAHCIGHPGVVVVPAAIAAAELVRAGGGQVRGRDVLEAIVVGYEIMARSGLFVGESHYAFWHPTCTLGSLGATAAACRLLGLDPGQAANALGLSGTMAGGLRQVFVGGTLAKHFHAGRAAQNGVDAALLAAAGLTGPEAVYEGPMGFARAFSGEGDRTRALDGIGCRFEIESNEFKLYASCRSAHAPLEAALNLASTHRFSTGDIESIDVGMAKFVAQDPAWGCLEPENPLAARLSVPYNVAVALVDGVVFLEQFSTARVADPEVRALCRKVRLRPDAESEALYPETTAASVRIILGDGHTSATRVDYPKGHARNPVSLEELVQKFSRVTRACPGADDLPALIMGMESAEDFGQFVDCLWGCCTDLQEHLASADRISQLPQADTAAAVGDGDDAR